MTPRPSNAWRRVRNAMPSKLAPIFSLIFLFAAARAEGRVIRLVVEHRESAASAGPIPYERLTGHFYGALDPKNEWNSVINDLLLAPRNAPGLVEYAATFTVLRPADPSRASGVLWYEVPNRGNSPLSRPPADAFAAGHIL